MPFSGPLSCFREILRSTLYQGCRMLRRRSENDESSFTINGGGRSYAHHDGNLFFRRAGRIGTGSSNGQSRTSASQPTRSRRRGSLLRATFCRWLLNPWSYPISPCIVRRLRRVDSGEKRHPARLTALRLRFDRASCASTIGGLFFRRLAGLQDRLLRVRGAGV